MNRADTEERDVSMGTGVKLQNRYRKEDYHHGYQV